MIKVLLVDDQGIIREGLSLILGLYDDIEIVGQASNGLEAIEFLESQSADIVLMDIRMPVMNGVEAVKEIKKRGINTKILILTTFNEDEYVFDAMKYGANGYLLKDVKGERLYEVIKSINAGNIILQDEITHKVVNAFRSMSSPKEEEPKEKKVIEGEFESLTEREVEIANLIMEGLNNKEIAERLYLSIGTVKNYTSKILSKLGLRDRTQIAVYLKER